MRSLRRTVQVLIVAALLVLPTAALSAQSGGSSADPYTMDDMGILAIEPYSVDTGAPATLPETGAQEGGPVWDGASDWPGVTQIIPAPEALPQTGALESGALAETEPGDVYFSSAAPSALPETGGKIPEPAIKNWRFEGFTLVPDWAEPGTLPETGAAPMYYPDVPSEPPLLVPVTPGATDAAPEALPQTGVAPSEPPYNEALPPFLNEEAPNVLPETGATSGLSGTGSLEERERLEMAY